jgi:ABC-2 type transport system permease protein
MLLRSVWTKTLRDHWRAILGWGAGLVAITVLELAAWPAVRDQAGQLTELVKSYPAAFTAMFSIEEFATGTGFIEAELFSLMVPLVMIVLGIMLGAGATAAEEELGTADLLLATPVSRRRVVLDKALAMLVSLAGVGALLFLVLSAGTAALGMGVPVGGLAAASIGAVLLGASFGAVALAVGCATGRRAAGAAVAAALALGSFLLHTLAQLVEALEPWQKLSLFSQYVANHPLRNGLDAGAIAVMAGVCAVMLVAAVRSFGRRDLAT